MLYTIKNDLIVVEISDHGAELKSLKRVNDTYEYLWQGDAKYWGRNAPVLFPIVGRLLEDTYYYEDVAYKMTQHGFARDRQFKLVDQTAEKVSFKLTDDAESRAVYPFSFELIIHYILEEDTLRVAYEVSNPMETILPFSIGAHPAFNWEEEAHFTFESGLLSTYLITDRGVSPQKVDIAAPNGRLKINKELFKDDALIMDDIDRVVYCNGTRQVEMLFEGFPYVGLWSKPSGAPFVCIEPWYGIADFAGHNQKLLDKRGIVLLDGHDVFKGSYTIKIS